MKKLIYLIAFLMLLLFPFSVLLSQEINPNGYNKFTYPNGNILSEGNMKDGKPVGYWKTYFVNGQIKSEGNRKANLLDSLWIFYNEKGDTLKKINYSLDKKNGWYYTFQISNDSLKNSILAKEMYVNDKKQGTSYYYYPNGNLHKVVNYKDNMKHGKAVEYKPDGKTLKTRLTYRYDFLARKEPVNRYSSTGEKTGKWLEFHENGKIKRQVTYEKGKITGLLKEYNETGLQIVAEKYEDGKKVKEDTTKAKAKIHTEVYPDGTVKSSGAFKNGKPVGIHKTFKEDGSSSIAKVYTDESILLAEGLLDDKGKKQDFWKFYYPQGELKSEGKYSSNRKIGEWKYYFKSGGVEQEGNYKGGRLSGKWYWYYETGELLRKEEYEKGIPNGESVEYTKAKEIITKGKYIDGKKNGKWFYNVGDHTQEGNYRDDKRTGMWKYYYPNGNLKYKCNYDLDKENGKATYYFKNKKIKEVRYYSVGIPDGIWRKYNQEGVEMLSLEYDYGELIRVDGVKLPLDDENTVKKN